MNKRQHDTSNNRRVSPRLNRSRIASSSRQSMNTEYDNLVDETSSCLALVSVPHRRFSLSQSICSYGYFGLAPNTWQPAPNENDNDDDDAVFERPLVFGDRQHHEEYAAVVRVRQLLSSESVLKIEVVGGNRPRTDDERDQLLAQVRRILRLDWSPEEFWNLHADAKQRGFGRTFRSPTLFEDMVKTITNCNMKWNGTVRMNRLLCSVLGHKCCVVSDDGVTTEMASFPTPKQVVDAGPDTLKEKCGLGYRTSWIFELAQKFVSGEIDERRIEDKGQLTDNELYDHLTSLKGFGKFASFNVMQLVGRFQGLPLDTETTRLFREEFGVTKTVPISKVHQQARDHYEDYAPYQFLAYWFDLWRNYEKRNGLLSPRWTIEKCASL